MSVKTNEELKEKKRPGRKPMLPEEKAAAAKARAAEKEKADNLKPEFFRQFQGTETDLNTLVEAAKADFHAEKNAPSSPIYSCMSSRRIASPITSSTESMRVKSPSK